LNSRIVIARLICAFIDDAKTRITFHDDKLGLLRILLDPELGECTLIGQVAGCIGAEAEPTIIHFLGFLGFVNLSFKDMHGLLDAARCHEPL